MHLGHTYGAAGYGARHPFFIETTLRPGVFDLALHRRPDPGLVDGDGIKTEEARLTSAAIFRSARKLGDRGLVDFDVTRETSDAYTRDTPTSAAD